MAIGSSAGRDAIVRYLKPYEDPENEVGELVEVSDDGELIDVQRPKRFMK